VLDTNKNPTQAKTGLEWGTLLVLANS